MTNRPDAAPRFHRWQVSLAVLMPIVLLGYVSLIGGGPITGGLFRWQLVTSILSVGLFGGWLLWRGIAQRVGWPLTGLEWAISAAALAGLLSLLAAPAWRLGLARLSELGGLAALFYLAVDVFDAGIPRRIFIRALIIVSGIALGLSLLEVYFYYQYVGQWRDLFTQPPYRLVSLLGHPNLFAGFVNLTLPFVAIEWRRNQRAWARSGLALWGIGYVVVLPFASSRGGLLGLGVMLAALGIWLLWQRGWTSARKLFEGLRGRVWIIGIAIALAVAAFVGLFIYQSIQPVHSGVFSSRLYIWQVAARVIAAHFWLGTGPGRFGLEAAHVISLPPDFWPLHAHSVFWQVFAEFGLIGWLAATGLIVGAARMLGRVARASEGEARAQVIWITAGLAGYATQNLVDDQTHVLATMVPLMLILALAISAQPERVRRARVPLAVMGLPLLLIGVLQAQWLWAYAAFDQAQQAYQAGDAVKALALTQEAARRDPTKPFYDIEAGLLAAQLEDWPTAQTHFEHAAIREGSLAFVWANLGVARWRNGDPAGGFAALESAAQLAPRSATIQLTAGWIAEAAGQSDPAQTHYLTALTLRPEWADRPFWDQTGARIKARAATLSIPDPDDPYPKALAALAAGHTAEARNWIDVGLSKPNLSPNQRVEWQMLLGDVLLAEGDEAGAMAQYSGALPSFANPSIEGTGYSFWNTYGFWLHQRQPLPFDSVPGLMPLDVTPAMLARFEQLSVWRQSRADCAGAQVIDRQRLRLDPDVRVTACP